LTARAVGDSERHNEVVGASADSLAKLVFVVSVGPGSRICPRRSGIRVAAGSV